MIRIDLLGPLRIEVDGAEPKLPKKARALVAYLAASPGPVSRERAADLLWPDQAAEQSRHSLRNCLCEIRRELPTEIRSDYEYIDRLRGAEVDVEHFCTAAAGDDYAAIAEATMLYRGEFLADFRVQSEPFEEWLATERARYLEMACAMLLRLAERCITEGCPHAAIATARQLVVR